MSLGFSRQEHWSSMCWTYIIMKNKCYWYTSSCAYIVKNGGLRFCFPINLYKWPCFLKCVLLYPHRFSTAYSYAFRKTNGRLHRIIYDIWEKKILRNAYCPTRQMRFFKYLIFEIGNKCGIIGRQKREKMFNIRERIKHNNGKVF